MLSFSNFSISTVVHKQPMLFTVRRKIITFDRLLLILPPKIKAVLLISIMKTDPPYNKIIKMPDFLTF